MRVVTDDGVGLEVTEQGSGPPLLLVHGFGGAKEDFSDHLDALGRSFRVVTLDLRGHGESDKPDDPAAYRFERIERDLVNIVDAFGFDTIRLLGHSMGGMVSRRLAIDHGERLDALILMDTSPGPVPTMDGDLIEFGAQLALDEGMDELRRVLDAFPPLDTPAYARVLAERPGYKAFQDRKWESLSAVMWATCAREIRDQVDQTELLTSIACPTLVIVGELDANFLEPARALAANIPGAHFVEIPDAGHSPQFENPEMWLREVEVFLAASDHLQAGSVEPRDRLR